ncbi:FUSC family protein [Nonomuraea sp. NPDC000554]|uniref:FUSC family protein n=1 Tax=Nonomuraea sp. NPDC000554 TaxID=3154259 RepID=UPI00332AB947
MRGAARALRKGFSLPARPPWGYGLLCGSVISAPLFVGTLAGWPNTGAFVALGAYLAAFGDNYGKPYARRARTLAVKIVLISAGCWLGLLVGPYPGLAVVVVGLLAAVAGRFRLVGTPPVLATVVGVYLAVPAGFRLPGEMAAGGVLYAAAALALWPVRRLHPLKDAFNAATDTLAALLDGIAEPEERWGELRDRASKALDAAGTASASFHSDEDSDRSADAYVQLLVRIFHETVALRGLRVQATDDREQIDEVVAALSRALRESAAGSAASVPAALAATAAFAERSAGLRALGRTDPASLRRVALLGQVRRCFDRIVVAVRTVGLLASDGVQAPARLPRLTWPPTAGREQPRHGWTPQTGRQEPEHAGRLGLAVAVAMALMLGLHEHYGKWFVFTVLLGLRSTYGDTVYRVVLRVTGTVLGAVVAAVILVAVPGAYMIAITVLVFATFGYALREVSFAYWSVFATPLAMMLTDYSTRLDWRAAGFRILLTMGGGVLALVAARVLWPHGQSSRLRGLTADLLREHALLVRALAERDLGGIPGRADAAGQAAERLGGALDKLEKEPGGRAPQELREAVTLARKLRDDAILLAAVLRGSAEGSDATAAVLDAVGDRLAAVAEAVGDDKPPPHLDAFEAGLAELAGEVSSLMQEAAAGESSAVRRELRHAVAAHPALKSLCADALDLARLVTT